jgi:UDP-N-acetylmuramoylalanine--D-glutamate ligase
VKKLFLCGATAPKIRQAVESCAGEKPEMIDCGRFEHAVRAAAAAAQEGDVVLMSPASASFDEFKNFMVRGECFKKIVKEL